MAIMSSMSSIHHERDYLRQAIRSSRSSDEARYYEEKLWRLDRELMHVEQMNYRAPAPEFLGFNEVPKTVKKEITPLSFLSNADTKLLLTGEAT
jgi:hypothetical protein